MSRSLWNPAWWLVLCSVLTVSQVARADSRALVVVVAETSPVVRLSLPEVRRLYMGLPIVANGQRLVPLLNVSESLMYQVFLQDVIHMSAANYERRLLRQVLRFGGSRPVKYQRQERLLQSLHQTPGSVSFMWRAAAQSEAEIRIIGELWQQSSP
jgi:hypothetical protein